MGVNMKISRKVLSGLVILVIMGALSAGVLIALNAHPQKAVGDITVVSELKHDPAEIAAKATPPANPRMATGGPYMSKEGILDKATAAKALGKNDKLSGHEEAVLMTEGEFRRRQAMLMGRPVKNLELDDDKEIWVVVLGGEFEQTWRSSPGDSNFPPAKWEMLKYDAKTGELLGMSTGPVDWPDAFFKELPQASASKN